MYKVINAFRDKDGTDYAVGEVFPSEGKQLPNESRIEVLSTEKNAYKKVFIEESQEAKEVKGKVKRKAPKKSEE